MPALAVAAELRADGAEVVFIGGERAEAQLVPQAGFALHALAVEGLSRSNPLRAARALARAALAVVTARRLLGQIRPQAVLGGGGYVAGPVGLAAVSRRVPLVITEADSHLGLANRVLAPFARCVCLAFPPSRAARRRRWRRAGPRYVVTGRPIARLAPVSRSEARTRLGIPQDGDCVLVFGGSLGARSINRAAIEAFESASFHVLHVAGRRDFAELASRPRRPGYDLREYLGMEEFAVALAASDLAVARAGGSVFELAAHGLPAVLVPYPHATGDHQSVNAAWMADAGAAVVVADPELTAARLAHEVGELLRDRLRLAAMAGASAGLARPDAARDVARQLLSAARR